MAFSFKRKLTGRFGKIIDTDEIWIDKRKYPTELRLKKERQYSRFTYTLLHIIRPGTEEFDWGVLDYVSDDDVNKLKDRLEAEIRKRYDVTWTDMICVCVVLPNISKGNDYNKKAALGITIQRYQHGVRAFDGTECHRLMNYRERFHDEEAGWYPYDSIYNNPSPAEKPSYHNRHKQYGIIEYTDESWEKLCAILDAIDALREKATSILTGEALAGQLALMTVSGLLLPEADDEEGFN